jgi:uncharacterized RDD family membrane protein YckC
VSRLIRNSRAQDLQGKRAGIASRALADVVDVAIAFGIYVGAVVGLSVAWDLLFSRTLDVGRPAGWVTLSVATFVLVAYLALGWATTGRTIGKQIMGLRVVRTDARNLRVGQAIGRAFLCAFFFPCLLLALVSRRNRGLEDVVCKTVVVYDWIPESTRPRRLPSASSSQSSREARA